MLAFQDDDVEVVDVGEILRAEVTPGLTSIYGTLGERHERNDVIVDRLPEVDTLPLDVEPVNAGADRAEPVGIGDAMSEPPVTVEPVERLTFASITAMMRHPVHGTDGPLGGNGGGRRRTKPVKIVPAIQPDIREGKLVPRWRVEDLTDGEKAYYLNRQEEALQVLRDLVGAIVRGEIDDTYRVPLKPGRRHAFNVFGLDVIEMSILKTYGGAARKALIDHAMARDGDHIKKIDAGFI